MMNESENENLGRHQEGRSDLEDEELKESLMCGKAEFIREPLQPISEESD